MKRNIVKVKLFFAFFDKQELEPNLGLPTKFHDFFHLYEKYKLN